MKHLLVTVFLFCLCVTASISNAYDRVTYIHNNWQGTPVAASDDQGSLEWRIVYYPFGSEYSNSEIRRENDISYGGKQLDVDTGLQYFGARHYDPVLGRFTSIDPVPANAENYLTFGRYSYANNNPYKYVDPDGELAVVTTIAIVVGLNALSIYLEARFDANNPCDGCVRSSGGIDLGLSGFGAKAAAGIFARSATKGRGKFDIDPRVFDQLKDARLGGLAGKLGVDNLQKLANNPSAKRFLDNRTGNINVIQEVEGKLLRITTPSDALKIISVGPIRPNQVANRIKAGDFTPLK